MSSTNRRIVKIEGEKLIPSATKPNIYFVKRFSKKGEIVPFLNTGNSRGVKPFFEGVDSLLAEFGQILEDQEEKEHEPAEHHS